MPDRYIVFDTETTGVDSDKRAVDVALLEIDPVTLDILGGCESLINPGIPIPPEATAIHGITDEMVKDAPTIEQWVDTTFGGKIDGEVALVGHRIDFDLPLFEPIGNALWTVDTLLLVQLYLRMELPDRKLDTLKEALGLPGGGQSHRAMADSLTAHQLLRHVLPLSGRTLEDVATTAVFMLHEMPWGKHEGTSLFKVPYKYRKWLRSPKVWASLDRHLRYSLEEVAKLDTVLPMPGKSSGAVKRTIIIPPRVRKPL